MYKYRPKINAEGEYIFGAAATIAAEYTSVGTVTKPPTTSSGTTHDTANRTSSPQNS